MLRGTVSTKSHRRRQRRHRVGTAAWTGSKAKIVRLIRKLRAAAAAGSPIAPKLAAELDAAFQGSDFKWRERSEGVKGVDDVRWGLRSKPTMKRPGG
jgi:hypothetical protein